MRSTLARCAPLTRRHLQSTGLRTGFSTLAITKPRLSSQQQRARTAWTAISSAVALTALSSLIVWTSDSAASADSSASSMQTLEQRNPEAYKEMVDILGDRFSVDEDDIAEHAKPAHSYHSAGYPYGVAHVHSTEEVSRVVKVCHKHRLPIVSYGTGTSLEGHTAAYEGGIVINLQEMNEILAIHGDDLDCVVQPGISWNTLNEELAPHGLWFPVDPGPGASIGGMVGTRCSGTNAYRYGTMAVNVLNLTVVLANGDIIKTAQRARKSSMGFDLTRLMIGSEGTLGIVTEATLKIAHVPEKVSVAVVSFPSIKQATQAAIATLQNGIQLGALELLNADYMDIVNKQSNFDYQLQPHLFLKFTGTKENVELDIKRTEQLLQQRFPEAGKFSFSKSDAERDRLWEARKAALWSCIASYPDMVCFITDVCVPVSRAAEIISLTEEEVNKSWLPGPIVAHIGDGNFHSTIMFNDKDPKDVAEVKRLSHNMVQRAIEMDGTATGEHGVGVGKMKYLEQELGAGSVNLMRAIKRTMDPHNLMNPGKLIPPIDEQSASSEEQQESRVQQGVSQRNALDVGGHLHAQH